MSMSPYLGCELCERQGVDAVGTTHLGGTRFEVCADCRTIVSEARGKIAQLPAASNSGKQWAVDCSTRSDYQHILRGTRCPHCLTEGTLGIANADGRYGCSKCLWEPAHGMPKHRL